MTFLTNFRSNYEDDLFLFIGFIEKLTFYQLP